MQAPKVYLITVENGRIVIQFRNKKVAVLSLEEVYQVAIPGDPAESAKAMG